MTGVQTCALPISSPVSPLPPCCDCSDGPLRSEKLPSFFFLGAVDTPQPPPSDFIGGAGSTAAVPVCHSAGWTGGVGSRGSFGIWYDWISVCGSSLSETLAGGSSAGRGAGSLGIEESAGEGEDGGGVAADRAARRAWKARTRSCTSDMLILRPRGVVRCNPQNPSFEIVVAGFRGNERASVTSLRFVCVGNSLSGSGSQFDHH